MAGYQINLDSKISSQFTKICKSMGLQPEAAIKLFIKQVNRVKKIPFPIEYDPDDFAEYDPAKDPRQIVFDFAKEDKQEEALVLDGIKMNPVSFDSMKIIEVF